jgi:DNA-binding transcriptional regulator/RsmH inhibitor MraZ
MFLGTFTPKLDEKSRLIFPAKFRDELASGLVMTRGQEHCIAVYPLMEFRQKLEIWSLPAWETYLEQKEEGFAETSEEVIPGLF